MGYSGETLEHNRDRKVRQWEGMRVEVYLFTNYVNDVNMAFSLIQKGWRQEKVPVEGGRLVLKVDQERKNKEDTMVETKRERAQREVCGKSNKRDTKGFQIYQQQRLIIFVLQEQM